MMGKISVESEQDKAIELLGRLSAECRVMRETGGCDPSACASCGKGMRLASCVSRMDDYSQLAMYDVERREYAGLSRAALPARSAAETGAREKRLRKADFCHTLFFALLWGVIGGFVLGEALETLVYMLTH